MQEGMLTESDAVPAAKAGLTRELSSRRPGDKVKSIARLTALSGRVAYHLAKERVTNPRPVRLLEVPPSPDHLTDEWLTAALCDGVSGARVLSHELGPRDDGTTSRRTLRVHYNDVGREAGLTEALFTKSSPDFPTRLISAIAGLAITESTFYTQIRPQLSIEAPTNKYSGFDPNSNRQLLITDDITQTRGAVFDNVLTRQMNLDVAEQIIDTLAALHATFWRAPLGNRFGNWLLNGYEYLDRADKTFKIAKRILVGFDRSREVVDPAFFNRRKEVPDALFKALYMNATIGPQTLLHGDVHPGNWFQTAEGRMGLHDWQCIVRGGGIRDVAYALSTHLPIEDRRNWERDLIARYCERLAEAGCEPVDFEETFTNYRQQMLYGVLMWMTTIGFYKVHPIKQTIEITLETIRRACQAATDHDTLDVIAAARLPL
jgi:thiamine kinase-like enzyme